MLRYTVQGEGGPGDPMTVTVYGGENVVLEALYGNVNVAGPTVDAKGNHIYTVTPQDDAPVHLSVLSCPDPE